MNKSYPTDVVRKQPFEILRAWGKNETRAVIITELNIKTDMRGVDSLGIAMLSSYGKQRELHLVD